MLRRDPTGETFKRNSCVVLTGTLADKYTGKTIKFVRGVKTSSTTSSRSAEGHPAARQLAMIAAGSLAAVLLLGSGIVIGRMQPMASEGQAPSAPSTSAQPAPETTHTAQATPSHHTVISADDCEAWGTISATWSYHPDNGLDVGLVEK